VSRFHSFIAITSLVLGGACGGAGSKAASTTPSPSRDRTVIMAEDMRRLQASNLYEVVQLIRPEWLAIRNTNATEPRPSAPVMSSDNEIHVYLDRERLGSVNVLRSMSVLSAGYLKFYNPAQAQTHFGSGNTSGVIQVIATP
jgi:hypothetical protein